MPQFVPIPERRGIDRAAFDSWIAESSRPIVMPGLVADWHMVGAARESPEALAREIRALDAGLMPHVIEAPADAGGRIFYRDDLSGFNFTRRPAAISATLERLLQLAHQPDAPALDVLSAMAERNLNQVPVVISGAVIGLATRERLLETMRLRGAFRG